MLGRKIKKVKSLFQPDVPITEIKHLPFSIRDGLRDVVGNKEISDKINKGYFKDRIVVVPALPKSASSVMGSCIAQMLPDSVTKRKNYARYMQPNKDSNLRLEFVKDFLNGGVLKNHTRATGNNLKVLYILGVKYIILFRHPIDQLVALYCHILSNKIILEGESDSWVFDHIQPLLLRMFKDNVNMEDTFQYMIRGGYLCAALSWMVDWLHFRNTEMSIIVRYEDFITNKNEAWNNISLFLTGSNLDEDILGRCNSIANGHAQRSTTSKKKVYPHGWTGHIGAWKNYFSQENKKDYLSQVSGFLKFYPNASKLLDIYPNLVEVDNL